MVSEIYQGLTGGKSECKVTVNEQVDYHEFIRAEWKIEEFSKTSSSLVCKLTF